MTRFLLIFLLVSPLSADSAPGSAADPTTIAGHNGDTGYFTFATGHGARILHSTDLVEWKSIGRVFDADAPRWAKDAIPKTQGIWAPDISFHNGLYHLYYSVSSFGSQHSVIGLAVNKRLDPGHPDNHWTDRGLVIKSPGGKNNFNAIDPALFVDDNGRWILFFGSFWDGIKAMLIDPETGKPAAGTPVIIDVARRTEDVPHRPIEAAYLIKKGTWYYLFVSWDHCCDGAKSNYKIVVGRSRKAHGPFIDKTGVPLPEGGGTLLLEGDHQWAGPGHNGVLQTNRGDFIVHHAYRRDKPELGRLFLIRPMTWSNDGWPQLGKVMNH